MYQLQVPGVGSGKASDASCCIATRVAAQAPASAAARRRAVARAAPTAALAASQPR